MAIVPLSFSPAIDSGPIDMAPENRNMTINIGSKLDNNLPAMVFSLTSVPKDWYVIYDVSPHKLLLKN